MKRFIIFAAIMGAAYPVFASHTITNTGKSGQKILVTDMFWSRDDCDGHDMTYELVTPPQNGNVTQTKSRSKLVSAKLNLSPPHKCEGKNLPISYVYYQSKKGFVGTDTFTVRWVSAHGAQREKSYTVTIN